MTVHVHGDYECPEATERECSIPKCHRRHYGRGWCRGHYDRWRRYGDPLAGGTRYDEPPEVRFWHRVQITETCWLWTGAVDDHGYGAFRVGGRNIKAHRFSYHLVHGETDLNLDHHRNCPKNCVNPEHLRPVTQKQNVENRPGLAANNTSGVTGVYWHRNRWMAEVKHNGSKHYVGRFTDIAEAEAAVIAKRNELFTHNDIDRGR